VEGNFCFAALLEGLTLCKGERIGLCNDWNNIDDVRQLFKDDNVNGFESMARGLNEEKTAMDARILDVSITLSGKLLSEIRRMLIFDVFDNRVPTSIVVNLIAIPRSIDNIET